MLNRRDFSAAVVAAALPVPALAQTTLPFYASTGPKLTRYSLDTASAVLSPQDSITLPANVSAFHDCRNCPCCTNAGGGLCSYR